jgi:hypothetical protein
VLVAVEMQRMGQPRPSSVEVCSYGFMRAASSSRPLDVATNAPRRARWPGTHQ